jgi:hypothetical protein
MEIPLEKAHKIDIPFLAYTKELDVAQETQKKTVETARFPSMGEALPRTTIYRATILLAGRHNTSPHS